MHIMLYIKHLEFQSATINVTYLVSAIKYEYDIKFSCFNVFTDHRHSSLGFNSGFQLHTQYAGQKWLHAMIYNILSYSVLVYQQFQPKT